MAFQLLQNMASGHVKVKKGTDRVFYMHSEKWNIDLEYFNMLIGLQCLYILC